MGSPPSLRDLNELINTRNVEGIISGHNGTLYHYTRPQMPVPEPLFCECLADYLSRNPDMAAAENYALIQLSREYGFNYKQLL